MSWQPPAQGSPGGPGGYGLPPGYPVPPPGYPPFPIPAGGQPYPGYPVGAYALRGAPGPAVGLVYAGFWWRFLGYLLDGLIISVPTGVMALTLATNLHWAAAPTAVCSDGSCSWSTAAPPAGWPLGPAIGYAVCLGLLQVLYFGVLVSRWGSTVGQRAVGARVVREEDPARPLPMERSLLRSSVFWVATLLGIVAWLGALAGLGELLCFLWVAWDPRKQGLHDKLGRSVVVRRSAAPVLVPVMPAYPYQPGYGPPQYAAPAQPPQPPQAPPAGWGR
ncbi:MAG: RDD family protein [Candidatus Dormibacteria bacterium]|jgi:uncharacterized RDD family membrane protein YckC